MCWFKAFQCGGIPVKRWGGGGGTRDFQMCLSEEELGCRDFLNGERLEELGCRGWMEAGICRRGSGMD